VFGNGGEEDIWSVLLYRYSEDEIKKIEMGRECGTYGGEKKCIRGFGVET